MVPVSMTQRAALFFVLLIVASSVATSAMAQDNVLDGILRTYRDAAATWQGTIVSLATNLFILLATIEFIWMGIRLAVHGADLQTWVGELIQRIMFIGLFLFLLLNAGFASQIVDSFRQAAGIASGLSVPITPADVLEIGLNIATTLTENVSIRDVPGSIGLIITALIMTIAFALMAAILLLAIVEMYILINAGIILLGFGGSNFTKDIAVRFLTYIVSVGAKLFVIQLVIGLGLTLLNGFVAGFDADADNDQALILLGVAITFLALVWSLPDMVQSIINGVAYGGSGGLMRAVATTAAGGAVAAGVAKGMAGGAFGGAHAVREASKLASAQGNPGFKGTMSNLGAASASTLADRITGTPGSSFGSQAGRTVDRLRQQRASQGAAVPKIESNPAQVYLSPADNSGNK
ncbi:P-type conjugative transfer protein TrbL [uncultured Roseobacter sp.]|uniref:P-type conjugative transfer protein TrbL n=1 Tax=uncultured Roseobacter sp. TaxID=114847 RepID=UPI0026205069|nr:P-type conjugative transfer protein TrbL [uncultured Roseobacter sp.]